MVKVRIYSEFSFKTDIQLKDVDKQTRDYDIQRHRKEIHDYLQQKLGAAFGGAEDLTLHYLEFDVVKD